MALKEVEQEEATSSPRISFSGELLDDSNFISINLAPTKTEDSKKLSMISSTSNKPRTPEFQFLAVSRTQLDMPTADELFFEGKLLPFWQTHHSAKLKSLSLQRNAIVDVAAAAAEEVLTGVIVKDESKVRTWFIDDDPSPRPPKCTVLWKELLRLKTRQRGSGSTLSTSSSSSSSSSSSLDMSKEKEKSRDSNAGSNSKNAKRVKRCPSIIIRPMVNVPICIQSSRQSSLPTLFLMNRGR